MQLFRRWYAPKQRETMRVYLVLILLTFSVTAETFSAEIVNFELAQTTQKTRPFEGVYEAVHEKTGEGLLLSVATRNGKIQISTLDEFSKVPRMITIDLTQQFEVRETVAANMGKVLQTTTLLISDENLTRTIIQENRFHRMEQAETLQLNGEGIIHVFKRRYFKRKYGVVGPWVADTTSFNANHNTLGFQVVAERTSNKGLTHQEVDNIGRQREEYVYKLKNHQSISTRDSAREAFRQGMFVRVKASDQTFSFDNVVGFPGTCARLFSSN